MMKTYKVILTQTAGGDLYGIKLYISQELREPNIARKLIANLRSKILELSHISIQYTLVQDETLAAQGMRKMILDNYLIFYVVTGKNSTVTVLRVIPARRHWIHLL